MARQQGYEQQQQQQQPAPMQEPYGMQPQQQHQPMAITPRAQTSLMPPALLPGMPGYAPQQSQAAPQAYGQFPVDPQAAWSLQQQESALQQQVREVCATT